ncbi:conserved hypothetical protein [Vibrio chagasii]|nr:conserved hypothetical protein [Vibrio chagasii]
MTTKVIDVTNSFKVIAKKGASGVMQCTTSGGVIFSIGESNDGRGHTLTNGQFFGYEDLVDDLYAKARGSSAAIANSSS